MTEGDFRAIYQELIDENPLAIRAVLQILSIEFTESVPTLAVSCTSDPVLHVNLGFVAEHCKTEDHVKAVIVHEFLHILLRHTRSLKPLTPARHLATDAVINAIIHRQLGPAYSGLMTHFYAHESGVRVLLRPPTEREIGKRTDWRRDSHSSPLVAAWSGLYRGNLCADDIEEIAKDLSSDSSSVAQAGGLDEGLLGGHEPTDEVGAPSASEEPLPETLARALDRSLESMNGAGIWRSPHGRGVGVSVYQREVLQSNEKVEVWCRTTFAVLKRHVDPAADAELRESRPIEALLPVLSTYDRRAALRSIWSPFLPEAHWQSERSYPIGGAQIYLDVSGSMNAEMPLIVKLLNRLGRFIRRPFWAFSNEVAPAIIRDGRLVASTSGGTSMSCVLAHVARTRPPSAVVVTDGYIERLDRELVRSTAGTRLHAVVTRDGSPALLAQAGIPFTQLGRLPQ